MSARLVTWACLSCGEDGMGDMPPEHEAHREPKPGDLVVIAHPSTGWGITMVPYAFLSPMQREGLFWRDGWWCAPLP